MTMLWLRFPLVRVSASVTLRLNWRVDFTPKGGSPLARPREWRSWIVTHSDSNWPSAAYRGNTRLMILMLISAMLVVSNTFPRSKRRIHGKDESLAGGRKEISVDENAHD